MQFWGKGRGKIGGQVTRQSSPGRSHTDGEGKRGKGGKRRATATGEKSGGGRFVGDEFEFVVRQRQRIGMWWRWVRSKNDDELSSLIINDVTYS